MTIANKSLTVFALLIAGWAVPAYASDAGPANPKGVVELFTSQGCSSCPPADAALGRLIRKGAVVALAYHVDYWDHLGWRDTFSSAKYTARQRAYAKTLHRRNVYTPQAVIDGRDHVVGSDQRAIENKVNSFASSGKGLNVPVSAKRSGNEVNISIGKGRGSASVVLVYFDKDQNVAVKRGENRGRTISYNHPVSDVQTVGMWDGRKMDVSIPASAFRAGGSGGCAVLLQSSGPGGAPGPILGATVIDAT